MDTEVTPIPQKSRHNIAAVVALVISVFTLISNFVGFFDWLQKGIIGPRILVSVLPHSKKDLSLYGNPDISTEFKFDPRKIEKLETELDPEKELKDKITTPGIQINQFTCKESGRKSNGQEQAKGKLYQLSLIIQNIGGLTAEKYELTISFNGAEIRGSSDPNVRIVTVEGDGMDPKDIYIYSQDPQSRRNLPPCIVNDYSDKNKPYEPSFLIRKSYRDIGLTRELVIVTNRLESALFQTLNLVIRVPEGVNSFLVIYRIRCDSCTFGHKLATYAQLVCSSQSGC